MRTNSMSTVPPAFSTRQSDATALRLPLDAARNTGVVSRGARTMRQWRGHCDLGRCLVCWRWEEAGWISEMSTEPKVGRLCDLHLPKSRVLLTKSRTLFALACLRPRIALFCPNFSVSPLHHRLQLVSTHPALVLCKMKHLDDESEPGKTEFLCRAGTRRHNQIIPFMLN
jgi:hypothetical protein